MKYLEIPAIQSKTLRIDGFDPDQDIEISLTDNYASQGVSAYLNVTQVKELISFLEDQLKTLE